MLNSRGAVYWPPVPQWGQGTVERSYPTFPSASTDSSDGPPVRSEKSSASWSARNRRWQVVHSTSGSVKTSPCPEATHTWRGRITLESSPTTSSRPVTIERHHWRLMLSLSSTPRG